jgi:hypothetical protein
MAEPKILPDSEVDVNKNYEKVTGFVCWRGVEKEILRSLDERGYGVLQI